LFAGLEELVTATVGRRKGKPNNAVIYHREISAATSKKPPAEPGNERLAALTVLPRALSGPANGRAVATPRSVVREARLAALIYPTRHTLATLGTYVLIRS